MAIREFLESEAGAVTADWVLLTANLVGVGLAVSHTSVDGVDSLANEVADTLSGIEITAPFERVARPDGGIAYLEDFSDGLGGFVGGIFESDGPYGGILRGERTDPRGAQAARGEFQLDGSNETAIATFDFHAIDSWDNEEFLVYVNDEVAARARIHWRQDGTVSEIVTDNPNIDVNFTEMGARENVGYSGWSEQSYAVEVRVDNPGDQLSLGFGSTLNSRSHDESWAVDNVSVTSGSGGTI
ncbi:MAG: hypothetical protein AAGA70_07465 [Pseudomonadota bacterium]